MTPIEADPLERLLREALATTPELAPSTDPLGTLDRRVRRARRRLAAGAGVVAAVVAAAIVVPLTVTGGHGRPGSVSVVTPPTESPSPLPPGTTALWTDNAMSAATADGQRWVLYKDGENNFVRPVGNVDELKSVQSPADYLVAGDNLIWVIGAGSGEAGGARSHVLTIDTRTGSSVDFGPLLQVSFAAAVGRSLYLVASDPTGVYIERLDWNGDAGMGMSGEEPLPGAQEIVATRQGQLWVHAARKLVEVVPDAQGFHFGATVDWGTGPLLAPALSRSAPDGVWAYDGSRLIGLMPSALVGCVSCAEGARVAVAGRPNAVVETHEGLFVSVPGSGLDYYSPDALGAGDTPVTASLAGVQVVSLVADPDGGVDYVNEQGQLIHWQPVAR